MADKIDVGAVGSTERYKRQVRARVGDRAFADIQAAAMAVLNQMPERAQSIMSEAGLMLAAMAFAEGCSHARALIGEALMPIMDVEADDSVSALSLRWKDVPPDGVWVQGAAVAIHAETVRLGAGAFAARALRSQGGARPGRGERPFEFRDRIENATGKDGGRIVAAGAFAGRADDARAFLRGLPFDEHGQERIAGEAVPLRHDQYVAAAQRVEGFGQRRATVQIETAGHAGIGEGSNERHVEAGGRLRDCVLLRFQS